MTTEISTFAVVASFLSSRLKCRHLWVRELGRIILFAMVWQNKCVCVCVCVCVFRWWLNFTSVFSDGRRDLLHERKVSRECSWECLCKHFLVAQHIIVELCHLWSVDIPPTSACNFHCKQINKNVLLFVHRKTSLSENSESTDARKWTETRLWLPVQCFSTSLPL